MSNEINLSASITYTNDNGQVRTISVPTFLSSATKLVVIEQTASHSGPAALNLGGIAAPKAFMVLNLDPTNFVTIYNQSSGKAVAILEKDPQTDGNGGVLLISKCGADWTAPYALADTADCEVVVVASF